MANSSTELRSAAPPRGLFAGTSYSLKAIWAHRELLDLLIRREIKSRYKDSSLGFLWSLIRPLMQLLIYYIAVGKFLAAAGAIPQFAIFIFTGLTAWGLFFEILNSSTSAIVNNSGLVKKVYFPRELFPLAAVGSALVNFTIQLGILVIAILLTQPAPFVTADVWLVPVATITLIFVSLAGGLFLAAANVYLRDVKYLVEVALLVLFWASPIVYSFSMVHNALKGNWLEQIYLWNPVTVVVMSYQKGLWAAGSADPSVYWPPDLLPRLLVLTGIGVVLTWAAQRFFARLEGNFAQEL